MSDQHPTYQGRRLPRPDDEVVDQGLAFDVGTLLSRRQVVLRGLGLGAGLGAAMFGLAACGGSDDGGSSSATSSSAAAGSASSGSAGAATTAAASATTTAATTASAATEIPDETAGPYPGDGSNGPDALAESGVVRSDIRTSFGTGSATAEGVPMDLELSIADLANGGAAFAGVAVYVWHCDREGRYSMYSEGVEDENYLRGVQIADADGKVRFASIFPACYSGRWPHIHFEVYPDEASIADAGNAIATSQVALPQDVCDLVYAQPGYEASASNLSQVSLAGDNVFGDDGGVSQLGTVTGDVASGFAVSLAVGVDTSTAPTGGGAPPGGGGQGGPPPDGGPA